MTKSKRHQFRPPLRERSKGPSFVKMVVNSQLCFKNALRVLQYNRIVQYIVVNTVDTSPCSPVNHECMEFFTRAFSS